MFLSSCQIIEAPFVHFVTSNSPMQKKKKSAITGKKQPHEKFVFYSTLGLFPTP